METWHKIGVFAMGLIGLVAYLYGSAKKAAEEIKEENQEKAKVPVKKRGIAYQMLFLALIIAAMFVIPKLLTDIITYLFPDPERISGEILVKLYLLLFYLGQTQFGNESYFFEGPGLLLLEWLLILSPYIIGFMIWSVRLMLRTARM